MLLWEVNHTQSHGARLQKDVPGILSLVLADIPILMT